jgi:hypothetical protein
VGPGAKSESTNHQEYLDLRAKRDLFHKYIIDIFEGRFPGGVGLDKAIEYHVAHIADDAEDLADNIIDLFAFFGADKWAQINAFLAKGQAEKRKKHNWTKATMGECAKVHMEDLAYWYYNLTEGAAKKEKVDQIIRSYVSIENSLPK